MLSRLPWPDHRNAWRRMPAAGDRTRWGVMRGADVAVIRFLDLLDREMADAHQQGSQVDLLSQRLEIRHFQKRLPVVGIRVWLYRNGGQHAASPVAVWLLGRCCCSPSALQVGPFLDQGFPSSLTLQVGRLIDQDFPASFGRQLAKTLRRIEAWHDLQRLAASFPQDNTIQRHAKSTPRQDFDTRLARFSRHVNCSHASPAPEVSRMPLWMSSEFWLGRPARDASLLRAILIRIHSLVHRA